MCTFYVRVYVNMSVSKCVIPIHNYWNNLINGISQKICNESHIKNRYITFNDLFDKTSL